MNQHKSELINSGIIWYGNVPKNWFRTKLKFLAEYQNGYPFKPEDWGNLGLPILRIAQLTSESEPNYFAGQISEKLKVNDGDLLFSWSATLDSFIWNGGSAWLNQHIFKVTPTNEADKKFLYWLLKFITPYLSDIDAHGSAMKHIKKESLGQTVFVPDKKTQESIANFLNFETSKIDDLIHKQQKLIDVLNEKIHIATMEIVTKGLNRNELKPISNVFWIKEIPQHWSVERIKTIFEIKKRIAGKLGFDVLSITQNGIKVKDIEGNDGQQSMDYSKYQIVEKGDFAMNHMDLLTGYVDIANQEGVTSPDYRVFSIRNYAKYYPGYYLLLLQLCYKSKLFYPFGQGSSQLGRWRLPTDAFNQFYYPVPPYEEQIKIADFVQAQNNKIALLVEKSKKSIDLLREHRASLISAAVTGKIDVRELAL